MLPTLPTPEPCSLASPQRSHSQSLLQFHTKELPIQEKFKFKYYLSLPIFPSLSNFSLCFRGFIIYIAKQPGHKGTITVSFHKAFYPIVCSHQSRIGRLDGQELGCCQDTPKEVCWIHTISYLILQIGQDLPCSNQIL